MEYQSGVFLISEATVSLRHVLLEAEVCVNHRDKREASLFTALYCKFHSIGNALRVFYETIDVLSHLLARYGLMHSNKHYFYRMLSDLYLSLCIS